MSGARRIGACRRRRRRGEGGRVLVRLAVDDLGEGGRVQPRRGDDVGAPLLLEEKRQPQGQLGAVRWAERRGGTLFCDGSVHGVS